MSTAYRRPMKAWWRRDPFFMRYMGREATALAVAVYALVLLCGLVNLARGEAAWNAWLAGLRHPLSLALHLVLLVAMAYHAVSWFDIMPKTMPALFAGGRRVAQSTITRVGWAVAALVTAAVLALVWSLR